MSQVADRPRLALGSWAFSFGPFAGRPWEFESVCRFAADSGYTGVEINGFRPHPHHHDFMNGAEVAALRDLVQTVGLTPIVYAPDLTAVPPCDVPAELYLGEIDIARAFCELMGIGLLRIDTVSPPAVMSRDAYSRRLERLVGTWAAAARRCAESGITLVWEFEPGFWLNRPSEVRGLVDAINEPAFRILFDSSHAYTGAVVGARQGPEPEILPGGEVEYARLLQAHVGHLHLIDSDGSLHDGKTSAHLPFGAGRVNFDALLRELEPALDALAWWGVDFCFCATTEADAPRAVPFLRAIAQRLHEEAVE